MTFTWRNIVLAAAVLLGTTVTLRPASALAFPQARLMLEALPASSAIAQSPTQDLLLRTDDNGPTYLYVEQQQGTRLFVFDVTNPEHMKLVRSSALAVNSAYDFVAPVKGRELISFRDGSGSALLDFHNPKAPRITRTLEPTAFPVSSSATAHSLASSAAPFEDQITTDPSVQARTVHFVPSGRHARVLATLDNVTRLTARPETGTTFLLAAGKVTIVRSPAVELQYDEERILPTNPD
jgi:hypothetical protein